MHIKNKQTKKNSEVKERITHRIRGIVPVMHTRLGTVPTPKGQTEKTRNSEEMGKSTQDLALKEKTN